MPLKKAIITELSILNEAQLLEVHQFITALRAQPRRGSQTGAAIRQALKGLKSSISTTILEDRKEGL